MTESITIEDLDDAPTPDTVAARCTEYEFNGKRLQPFTKGRLTAARCMEAAIFLGRAKTDENNIWPEMFLDAQITVWLCTVDPSRVLKACRKPSEAMEDVFSWWEKNGGTFGTDAEAELLNVFSSIMADLTTVSAEVDTTGKKSSGDALGE